MKQITRIFIVIAWILPTIFGACSGTRTEEFLILPYLQHAQFESIVISWKTTVPTFHNEVRWGKNQTMTNVTVEPGLLAKTFHSVRIKGLSAGQKYYYTVVSDGIQSHIYSFWTAVPNNDTIRFVVYGDSRGGWDAWRNASLVAHAIEHEKPLFVLSTGDLVDNGWRSSDWVDFFSASSFLPNSTFYPVLGNHERSSILYFFFFSLPLNERWYSFDNGPVHFIGLDSNPGHAYRFTQYLWLLHDLRTHRQPFTVVFFHHPLYSSGNHGNTTLLQKVWAPVFKRFNVDIVFNGHEHSYEHSAVHNVTYIVTGGGGAPLYDVGCSPWTIYSEKTYHYCLLTVNSSILTFEAKKPDGFVFDRVILTK